MSYTLVISTAFVLSLSSPLAAQGLLDPTSPAPLTGKERAGIWARSVIGPGAFAKSAFTAGIGQWRDKPEEWGQGMEGYGHRFASRMGIRFATNSIRYGLSAVTGEDPRYFPSGKTRVGARLGHAVKSTFWTRYDGGGYGLASGRLAGDFAGAAVANTWYPERLRTVGQTMKRGSFSLAGGVAGNVFREFWPDLRRLFRRK